MTVAGRPSELVTGVAAYLRAPATPSLYDAGAREIREWLPAGATRLAMPLVAVHVAGIPDRRVSITGGGGVRRRTFLLACDVWWSVTAPDPTGAQRAMLDLVDAVVRKLALDPTLGGTVTHSGGDIDATPVDDTYQDLLDGRGVIAWRVTTPCDIYPLAS